MSWEDEVDRRLRVREVYVDAMLGMPDRKDPKFVKFARLLDGSSLGTLEAKVNRLSAPAEHTIDIMRRINARTNTPELTMTEPASERDFDTFPYRIVDAHDHGWLGDGKGSYHAPDPSAAWQERMLDARPLAQVEAEYGPWRPVEPYTPAERDEFRAALETAGTLAVGSVVAAIEQVFHDAHERYDPAVHGPDGDYRYAQRSLTAGRPGSWEADALVNLTKVGFDFNVYPPVADDPDNITAAERLTASRAAGPDPHHVHREARDRIAAVLRAWTTSPDRYVEVAENLAHLVSFYADDTYGCELFGDEMPAGARCEPGCMKGWRHIADKYLQPEPPEVEGEGDWPASYSPDNFLACYRLLYSVSDHHNTDVY